MTYIIKTILKKAESNVGFGEDMRLEVGRPVPSLRPTSYGPWRLGQSVTLVGPLFPPCKAKDNNTQLHKVVVSISCDNLLRGVLFKAAKHSTDARDNYCCCYS